MDEKARLIFEAVDRVTTVVGGIATSVGSVASRIGESVRGMGGAFKEGFDKGVQEGGHLRDDMGKTADKAGGLGHAIEGVGNKLSGFANHLKGALTNAVVAPALNAIGSAISGIKSAMIDGNAEFERYQVQFGVLLGSSDAAKQRLDDLAKFGASTPFELPQVVQADKILQSFGLHSEEAAKRFGMSGTDIRTIAGDVAAGTGAGFDEIAGYIGKFSSGATGEAISRFQELGIVTRAELAKMGLEFSKSGELLSPLDKSTQVVLEAMKKKFGGMMDAQSATMEGMASNLQDWMGQAGRIIGQPIFEAFKDKLSGLLTFLNSPAAANALQAIAGGIANGISTIIGLASQAIQWFTANWPAIQAVIGSVLGQVSTGVTNATPILDTIRAVAANIVAWFVANWPTIQAVIAQVVAAFQAAVAWFVENWPAIQAKAQEVFSAISTVVTTVLVPAIQNIITLAMNVVKLFVENWPIILAAITPIVNGIVTVFQTVLIPAAMFVLETFAKIIGFFVENWPLIAPIVTAVLQAIVNVVNLLVPPIVTVFQVAFNTVRTVVSTAVNLVLDIVKRVLLLLNGNVEGALGDVRDFFVKTWTEILDWLSHLPENFVKLGTGIIQGLIDGLKARLGVVKEFFDNLSKDPVAAMTKFFEIHSPSRRMYEMGKNVVAGFAGGINDMGTSVVSAMAGTSQGVVDGLAGPGATNGQSSPATLRPSFRVYVGTRELSEVLVDTGAAAMRDNMARSYG